MKIVLSRSDAVTAYGWGVDALWDGLMGGVTAIRPTDRFSKRGFAVNLAATVPDLSVERGESRVWAMLKRLLSPLVGQLDPSTPVILATTVGEIEFVEQSVLGGTMGGASPLLVEARPDTLLARIKSLLGLSGPGLVISSACASSSLAVSRAASMVRSGAARQVLVIASDAVSEFVYSGFSTLSSLCDTPARPFDANRCGLTLGEAAAWTLVSSADSTADATPVGSAATSIIGWGSTSDAWHMTAPDPQASGLIRAIAKACAMGKRSPSEISFVSAHGTATVYSDAMELVGFRRSLPGPTPVFSIKGAVGHTLGATGLLQILVTGRALAKGVVPPTIGMSIPDPNAVGWVHGASTPIESRGGSLETSRVALSTNSGFGGVNTAILLARDVVDGRARP